VPISTSCNTVSNHRGGDAVETEMVKLKDGKSNGGYSSLSYLVFGLYERVHTWWGASRTLKLASFVSLGQGAK